MLMVHSAMAAMTGAGVTAEPVGQQLFTSSGAYQVPAGVTSICVAAVGWGGIAQLVGEFGADGSGGGGGCAYVNYLPVDSFEFLDVVIVPSSSANSSRVYLARSGVRLIDVTGGWYSNPGQVIIGTGFAGGSGATPGGAGNRSGGGAGGYTSPGGTGNVSTSFGGGGTSLLGGGPGAPSGGGVSINGATFGGGAGVTPGNKGAPGPGGLRIIHGADRAFPNTNTGGL